MEKVNHHKSLNIVLGTYSTVYKGKYDDKQVAIKLIENYNGISSYGLQESKILQEINHENIIKLITTKVVEKGLALVLELCPNTIHDIINTNTE